MKGNADQLFLWMAKFEWADSVMNTYYLKSFKLPSWNARVHPYLMGGQELECDQSQ